MKKILIIGGGHAGTSAAFGAFRNMKLNGIEDLEIHLIDKNPYMTIKPRLYEYELEETIIPFSEILTPAGIHFHQDEVANIDFSKQIVKGQKENYPYDVLIIAAGSDLSQTEKVHNVNSYKSTKALQDDLNRLISNQQPFKVAVLGGGFTGLEVSCELPINIQKYANQNGLEIPDYQITLFDHHETGAALGKNPQPEIVKALKLAGVKGEPNSNILSMTSNEVIFENEKGQEEKRQFDLVINTLGQKPSAMTQWLDLPKNKKGQVLTNRFLQVQDHPNLFTAGDMASIFVDESNQALMTCQQGRPQGRYAGQNAVALLYQLELMEYSQPNYITCIDLGAYGALYTTGWDRQILYKGEMAKRLKQHINQERIYPPRNGTEEDYIEAGQAQFVGVMESIKESRF